MSSAKQLESSSLNVLSYGSCAIVSLALTIQFLFRWQEKLPTRYLFFATAGTFIWAASHIAPDDSIAGNAYARLLSGLFLMMLWMLVTAALLHKSIGDFVSSAMRFGGIIFAAALIVASTILDIAAPAEVGQAWMPRISSTGLVVVAILGLSAVEQVFRNLRSGQASSIKFLCIGVSGIYLIYLIPIPVEAVYGRVDSIEEIRGFAVSMCLAVVAVSVHRHRASGVGLFVSRWVVFYSLVLVSSVLYLLALLAVLVVGRVFGIAQSEALEVLLVFAAVLIFLTLLVSETLRGRLHGYVNKHFFESKYDYRQEWLRLNETLTAEDEALPLRKRAIKGLAQIVNSPSGTLWLAGPNGEEFLCAAGWNLAPKDTRIPADDAVVLKMMAKYRLPCGPELRDGPDNRSEGVSRPDAYHLGEDAMVPLTDKSRLVGFVILSKCDLLVQPGEEDLDLLRTAGQQVASYVVQEIASEKLLESRQFEAFHRFTAYLMHDLKNLLAQQILVVENAEKHRNNPKFIDDAIETIRGGVTRMRRVLEHLQHGSREKQLQNTELGKLLTSVVSQCADRQPVPCLVITQDEFWVRAERERLQLAIYHAVRNAQDATPAEGSVTVTVRADATHCLIDISDTGTGMDEEFVRQRLFRPFDSTKGTQGMGIGAYQIRETVLALGGELSVESTVGKGTTVLVKLNLLRHLRNDHH